jgi:hypothetical protein
VNSSPLELPPEPRLFLLFHALVVGLVVAVVALTSHGNEELLSELCRESGPFELGSSLVLLVTSAYSIRVLLRERRERRMRPVFRILIAGLALLTFVAAFEEVSWGQHLLEIEPSEFFLRHNQQEEQNLHNLLPAKFFNALIDTGSYVAFVYLPILIFFESRRDRVVRWVRSGFLPFGGSLHNVLVFGFGFALQAYGEPLAVSDSVALGVSYFLLVLLLARRAELRTRGHVLHLVLLILVTCFFVAHRDIFEFANMQYEIREFVFTYALLHLYADWIRARRDPRARYQSVPGL